MWISEEVRAVLSPFSIYFNEIDLTEWFFPKQDKGRGLPEREVEMITIPGRAGSLITGKRTPARFISQEVLIACESAVELRKKLEELNEILHTNEPVPLQFEDEMDRTYYAMYAGASEGYEIDGFYTATITFLCSDPYKYSEPKTLPFVNGSTTIHNNGTVEVSPIIKATVLEDITYMDVFTDNSYMRIGKPVDADSTPIQRYERLLSDSMTNLLPWSATSTALDGGVIAGTIEATDAHFEASSFGTGVSWHGPALKRSFTGAPLTDFKVTTDISFYNPSSVARGRLEIYLLDDQGRIISKLAMKRIGSGAYGNTVEARVGDNTDYEYFVNYAGATGTEWRDFYGRLEISRIGNVWTVYVARVDPVTGEHTARHTKTFTDTLNKYIGNLSQVQVHFGQSGTSAVTTMRNRHISVYRVNPVGATETAVIANAGDVIEIDHTKSSITINGENKQVLKDFSSQFFKLPTGENMVSIEPSTALTADVTVREAFL